MSDAGNGLICAYLRTPNGIWNEAHWVDIENWRPEQGLLWVHLDADDSHAQNYLRSLQDVDQLVPDALLAEETRPRSVSIRDGLLAILRGVNLNHGADPEDMVSIRLWIEQSRLLSTRRRPLMAVQDVQQRLTTNRGPSSIAELFTQLVGSLVERASSVIEDIDAEADRLESVVVDAPSQEVRAQLAAMRRQTIALRRYLAPQREALGRIQSEEFTWLDRRSKANLREITDRVVRYVEDLDLVRERAAVIQDELVNRQAEQMNRNMYLLAIVATVMLPLGFITGLLGVNVDGIPGSSNTPWAFTAVTIGLVLVALLEFWVLRRMRWV
ncbi:MAG: zinc transporter ZntB [Gammaproteobacteria bacterium]|nr:zinc transporter ZntB [Gammaproteobacteria bacterium]